MLITAPETTKKTLTECTNPVWDKEKNRYLWKETTDCETTEAEMVKYKQGFINDQAHYDTLTPKNIANLKAKAQEEIKWVEAGEATK